MSKSYPKNTKWNVGDSVLVKYNGTKFYYEAKIICVTRYDDQPSYKINYPGWSSYFNEDFTHEEAADCFMEFTEENRRKAKEVIAQATESESNKRKSTVSNGSSKSFIGGKVRGGSSRKKPKNGHTESPSVTDRPVSSFKSVSQKMKTRSEKKILSVESPKRLSSLKVKKKQVLPEVEKKPNKVEVSVMHADDYIEMLAEKIGEQLCEDRKCPQTKMTGIAKAEIFFIDLAGEDEATMEDANANKGDGVPDQDSSFELRLSSSDDDDMDKKD